MVSRTVNKYLEVWGKRKSDEHEQFPVKISVIEVDDDDDDDDEIFENSMPIGNSPEFNPSTIINVNNQENLDDEEYRLFGTSSFSNSSSSEDLVEELKVDDGDDDHSNNDDADDGDDEEEEEKEEEEMDDDVGTLFFPLVNSKGLNLFVNNELSNSSIMIDYFHDECFGGTELSNECLLIALYMFIISV